MSENDVTLPSEEEKALGSLIALVRRLRGERGCPWDRKQDYSSMLGFLMDECKELAEAVSEKDFKHASEELGDVLFVVLSIAEMGREAGDFDLIAAARMEEDKMVRRHPHIFGPSDVSSAEEVIDQWHKIKARERLARENKEDPSRKDMPEDDSLGLATEDVGQDSALERAQRLQEKVSTVDFDWERPEEVLAKIEEELREVRKAIERADREPLRHELGDLLFSVVNLARFLNHDAEELLDHTIRKFITRFRYVESELRKRGKSLEDSTLDDMEALWQKSKKLKE